MAMARTVAVGGLVLASIVAGCGNARLGSGGEPIWMPQVDFQTRDRSTGVSVAAVRIYDENTPRDVVDMVATRIRVATWPGDVEAPTTQTLLSFPSVQIGNGGREVGYVEIDEELDPSLDASAWYAISMPMPASTAPYSMPASIAALALDGGATGVRFSPAHAPVVSSIVVCAKDQGVVAVYVGYSEPVTTSAGTLPSLDYGNKPVSCAVGEYSSAETQFICMDAGAEGQAFLLRIPDGVTAQASGTAMLPTTLDSNGMQVGTTANHCTIHLPLAAD
jgi:hypothetical protein